MREITNSAKVILVFILGLSSIQLDATPYNVASIVIDSIIAQPGTCNLDNGTITIYATSTTDLEYSLDDINYQPINFFNDLPNKDYLVYVMSSDGCVEIGTTQILNFQNPPGPEINNCASTLTMNCNETDPSQILEDWAKLVDATNFRMEPLEGSISSDLSQIDFSECGVTLPIELEVIDVCGARDNCSFDVTIIDTTAPIITCPIELTIDAVNLDYPDRIEEWFETVLVLDDCSVPDWESDLDESRILFQCEDTFTIDVQFLVTDRCDNTSICTSSIFVINELMPDIICEAALTVECGADPEEVLDELLIQFEDINAFDEDITVEDNSNIEDIVGKECGDTVIIFFSVIDGCGRPSSCSSEISIEDSTIPEIDFCPTTLIINSVSENTVFEITNWLQSVEASDECAGSLEYLDDLPTSIDLCNQADTIDVIFTVSDKCMNMSSCSSKLFIAPQSITLTCPSLLTVECGDESSSTQIDAWLLDAESLDQNNNVIEVENEFTGLEVLSSCDTLFEIRFFALDPCGAEQECMGQIQVVDNTAPTITCPNPLTFSVTDNNKEDRITEWLNDYVVTDQCFSDIDATYDLEVDVIDFECGGLYTVTYTTVDLCDNIFTCSVDLVIENDRESNFMCPDSLLLRCTSSNLMQDIDDYINSTALVSNDSIGLVNDFEFSTIDSECNEIQNIDITFTLIDNCSDSKSCVSTIQIIPDLKVYLPNTMSQGTNGNNSSFTVFGNTSVDQVTEFMIYDRWGNLVWEKASDFILNDESHGWNGNQNGNRIPGVYTYMIAVSDVFGEITSYSGSITLLK